MYSVRIKKKAQKQLMDLPLSIAGRIAVIIDGLAENPRPSGSKKLQGYNNVYRIREADYRIIYRIENEILTVEIIKIGHRKDIYRGI
ncbi:MAG: type II toxin-antitoxin system RelE/ParE family toxin [Tannerella sp.]|jgi:mRNA interferase RelE/StbE|nr:type II toxin-antitoxin system RelE/ParE family toxin [Tannerella sp.]